MSDEILTIRVARLITEKCKATHSLEELKYCLGDKWYKQVS